MTLKDFIGLLETSAGHQPAVHTIVRNDIYRLNALPSVKYGVFAWHQIQHRVENDLMFLSFRLVYADRLNLSDGNGLAEYGGNEIEIQSVAIRVLANVIRLVRDNGVGIGGGDYTIDTFNQRFSDQCAGAFATVTFSIPVDSMCGIDGADFNNDFNNDFDIL